jgi:hypothetical protein
MELMFWAARKFDIPGSFEVGDDFMHLARAYISIHGYFFC